MVTKKVTKKIKEDILDTIESPLCEKFGPALLFSDINSETAMNVVQWIISMNMLDNPPPELTLLINSEGGDLCAGMAIIEAVISSKIPIKTIGLGQIQSAGLLIFMAGAKGRRIITPTCMAMTHHFNTGSDGSYSELKNLQKEYDRLDQLIVKHYLDHTGVTEKVIRKFLVTDHDVYLSPEEVVAYGLADKIGPLEY